MGDGERSEIEGNDEDTLNGAIDVLQVDEGSTDTSKRLHIWDDGGAAVGSGCNGEGASSRATDAVEEIETATGEIVEAKTLRMGW